jgi:uridine kinase
MPAFVIGIGGGSASGKSTIAGKLKARLAPLSVEVINQDRFFWDAAKLPRHSNQAGDRTWPDYNHPASFDFASLRLALRAARDGGADVVVLEGILALHDAEVRGLMDLKLFVEAEADERIVRRIRRNVAGGHNLDRICDFYLDSVRYRHRGYCQPTKAYADLVIPGGQDETEQAERMLEEVCRRVRAARAAAGAAAEG